MSIKLAGITALVDLDQPIYVGSHFNWGEATMGGSRLPIQTNFEGIIIPAAQITSNIISIAHKLDEIREIFGDEPITINSWYRPPLVNRRIGSVPNSQHLLGWGVDFVVKGTSPTAVANRLAKTWQGGLGDNRAFTHVDLRQLMGRGAARWDYGTA